jgi:hypothetical protein
MANKYDEPPAYTSGPQAGPQPPQPSYQQEQQVGYPRPLQGPGNPGQQYYQPNQQMGYYQQNGPPQGGYYQQGGPPQGGYYQQGGYPPPQQGGYYGQQGYYPQGQYQNQRSGPGCLEGILAGLACCCCLDLLF